MFTGPNIVKSGLVYYLDPGNYRSYPGSGNTWYDLSGNGYHSTLVNTPTFNSNFLGSLDLDGTNEYVYYNNTDFSIANNLFADSNGNWTVSAWFKWVKNPTLGGGNSSESIVGRSGGIGGSGTFVLFCGNTDYNNTTTYKLNMIIRGKGITISQKNMNDNKWHEGTVVWDGTNVKGYVDGKLKITDTPGTAGLQTYYLNIGTTANGQTGHLFQGSIGRVKIYNIALSDKEIFKNYKSFKSRFRR